MCETDYLKKEREIKNYRFYRKIFIILWNLLIYVSHFFEVSSINELNYMLEQFDR